MTPAAASSATLPGLRVLAVSPHLDDAAFSAGAVLATLAARGAAVTVVTCFTASVPEPTGFALACQLDKGLAPDVDYLALRRAEDTAAMRCLGVLDFVHLPLPEAPHRGYSDAAALFAGVLPGDDAWRDVAGALARYAAAADVVLAPQGCGAHADHLQVVRAVRGLGVNERVGWWRDSPYVLRRPDAAGAVDAAPECALPVDGEALAAKLDACAAYRSQLGFQFGGEAAMRAALADFAEEEGRRGGAGSPAEVLAGAGAEILVAALSRLPAS